MKEVKRISDVVSFIEGWLFAIRTGNPEWDRGNYTIRTLEDVLGFLNGTDIEKKKSESIKKSTGHTDKFGHIIYEDDIVKTKYGRKCKVVWKETDYFIGFDLNPIDWEKKVPDEFDIWKSENLEVVGDEEKTYISTTSDN